MLREYLRAFDPASDRVAPVWARGAVGFVQNAAEWWLESRAMTRDELAEDLTMLLWAQIDGIARRHWVALDPEHPVTVEGIVARLGRDIRSSS